MELRKELAAQKKSECARLTAELENVERQLYKFVEEAFKDRELRFLSRLIFTGTRSIQSDSYEILKGGETGKNAELIEVRDKLDDKEKKVHYHHIFLVYFGSKNNSLTNVENKKVRNTSNSEMPRTFCIL